MDEQGDQGKLELKLKLMTECYGSDGNEEIECGDGRWNWMRI